MGERREGVEENKGGGDGCFMNYAPGQGRVVSMNRKGFWFHYWNFLPGYNHEQVLLVSSAHSGTLCCYVMEEKIRKKLKLFFNLKVCTCMHQNITTFFPGV